MKQFFLLFAAVVLAGGLIFFGTLQANASIDTLEKTQAVCNVSPTKEGTYTKEGCETAFNALPAGALKCAADETVKIGTCTVNSDACTNSEFKTGRWCTCTYTCNKKTIAVIE